MLLVAPKRSGIGGIAQHVSKLGEKLVGLRHEVDYLSCECLPCVSVRGLANPSFMLLSAFSTISKRLRREKYDVVHGHNVPSCVAMKLTSAGRVLTLHGIYSKQVKYLHGTYIGRIATYLERKALAWSDVVTAVSRSAVEWYRKYGIKVLYIPNAIDLSDLPREEERLFDRQIVFVGRLSREKGPDVLLEAFKKVETDAHLIFIGDGPLRAQLEAMAKDCENVHFLGFKARDETLRILKASDLFVLPSRHEGLSTALLEAMALRVPVIATRVGGNVELIDENTGVLVDPENPEQMGEAIIELLSNRKKAKYLAENAYKKVVDTYNWDRVVHSYVEVYRMAIRG